MSLAFKSSRVLLIAPKFFGYESEVAAELTRLGYIVDFLPDRPFDSAFMKAVMRFRPELGHFSSDRFFANQLEGLGRSDYSAILVIQGEGVTIKILEKLRAAYPRATLSFYTWDSIENKPFSKSKLNLYDHCSTFDPLDAKKYSMSFRPLFYTDGFDRPKNLDFIYDLSFIGTVHSDRYSIVRSLIDQLPHDARTFVYFYLQAPWMYDIRRIFTHTLDGGKREDFQFVPLTKSAVQATFFGSRTVLDIEHASQRGATMRTMEALGAHRKMVTTNPSLRDYDFYNPLNIHIIDRKAPEVSLDFLRAPYQSVNEKIRKYYSIRQWIFDVCKFKHDIC
jgi:hypothetical protein